MADIKRISDIKLTDLITITAFMYYVYPPIAPWLGYYNDILGSNEKNPVDPDKPYTISHTKLCICIMIK